MASSNFYINDIDRTSCVSFNKTMKIKDSSDSEPSILELGMEIRDGGALPKGDDDVELVQSGTTLFAGKILKLTPKRKAKGSVVWQLTCIDYNRDLDRNLVVESYEDMTDKEIITDIIHRYAPDFSVNNVVEGVTIEQIVFNYTPPSECFEKICELTGRTWYADYDKDIHYLLASTNQAPFNISE